MVEKMSKKPIYLPKRMKIGPGMEVAQTIVTIPTEENKKTDK